MTTGEELAESAIQSRVAHNTLLNVLGLAVPLALAFFVMPVAARHLGPARFGLGQLGFNRFGLAVSLGFGGIEKCLVQLHALAAEHDRADGDTLLFLVQIGNRER